MEQIKFVNTPRCADCRPKPEMLRRRSCVGCVKYNDKVLKELFSEVNFFKEATHDARTIGKIGV